MANQSAGRALRPAIHGILLVDKPAGISSAEVVRRIKRRVDVKVGHLGTLDPFATGLLPLCLGDATKVAQFLNASDKVYEGAIQLGVSTDTGDCTGAVREERMVPALADADVARAAAQFTGEIRQTPPMYSAIKREGVPLYKLARAGVEVAREDRPVTIHRLEMQAIRPDRLRFRVSCSKGTYVRVLAEDLGRALGTVAHLAELRRVEFGDFRLDQGAVHPDTWDPSAGVGLLSIREALSRLPAVAVDAASEPAVRHGKKAILDRLSLPQRGGALALLLAGDGRPLAVVERAMGRWHFARVLG